MVQYAHSVSKKDSTVSHSSTEAEIKAIDLCVKTVLHLRNLLTEMKFQQLEPTVIHIDNISSKLLIETFIIQSI